MSPGVSQPKVIWFPLSLLILAQDSI
jgi:hypothetical protein